MSVDLKAREAEAAASRPGFDAVAQTISIMPDLPVMPMVLCDAKFINTLAQVEREVAGIAIADAASAQAGANLLTRLTGAGVALEKAWATLKAPILAAGKLIDDAARAPADRIEAAKRGIKAKVAAFNEEQERAARKLEAERQAELRRLEAQRREEERQAEAKAAELARQAAEAAKVAEQSGKMVIEAVEFDDGPPPKTETEKAIESVKFAPVAAPVKPAGVRYNTRLIIASLDPAKLPEQFITRVPKEAAIRALFCTGWKEGDPVPECAGVSFAIDKTIASTGKAEF